MQEANFWTLVFPYIAIFIICYFLLIVPYKRREKKKRQLINSLKEGDNIVTTSGIIGKITHIKDDEISIETGLERTKIKIASWAVEGIRKSN